MVVQHNLTAMNANRMLGVTTGQQAKSSEKLSSGYRINRAADDAAGLTISEKMRKQIKGLDQASTNAQDGVSAVQTAEGALTEVHAMLQRMNELAVQSANGTNAQSDRDAIQAEIDQLATEIDRVAETTKFNETYLLKGDDKPNGNKKTFAVGDTVGKIDGLDVVINNNPHEFTDNDEITLGTVDLKSSDGTKFAISTNDAKKKLAENITKIELTDTDKVTVTYKDGTQKTVSTTDSEDVIGITVNGANKGDTADISKTLTIVNTGDVQTAGTYTGNLDNIEVGKSVTAKLAIGSAGATALATGTKPLVFSLHVGADSDDTNKISVTIDAMSAKGIGVDGLKVDTEKAATAAIDTIANAVQKVSTQRSALGAVQNRLEHTIANLDNVVENTTAAESRIRDTDMAEEMVEYSKNNILAQAGQSMLAQANQSTQGVLSLLQ